MLKYVVFCSLRLPFGRYFHFEDGRKIGESKPGYNKGLVYYNRRKKPIVKTVRSVFGEPNHYDQQGNCVGYSRYGGWSKIIHFDSRGNEIGYSHHIFHVMYMHRILEQSDLWHLVSPSKRKHRQLMITGTLQGHYELEH